MTPYNIHRGRKHIYSDAEAITAVNVVAEINKAAGIHSENESAINYLFDYVKGKTPIYEKINEIRPEINNIVVENRADEIVTFKTGYLLGEPIQYINRTADASVTEDVARLNGYMAAEDKQSHDNELAWWMHVCGVAYRVCLSDREFDRYNEEGAPFNISVPSPADAFVIRSSGIRHEVLAGVYITRQQNGRIKYHVYTDTEYFVISGKSIEYAGTHTYGAIPVTEYELNIERQGAFEKVLPLLDALNKVQSERVDDVEQFVKAFMVAIGTEIDEEIYESLKKYKLLNLPDTDSDIKLLAANLQQSDTQTLKNDLYRSIIEICGMPNRNGSSSTSDTGAAVVLRDGWQTAETNAQNTELRFKIAEKQFLKLALRICADMTGLELRVGDIDIKFTRRNYEGISTKAAVLTTMLGCEKIHPKLAFQMCNMFPDAEQAYLDSMEYYDVHKTEAPEEQTVIDDGGAEDETVS